VETLERRRRLNNNEIYKSSFSYMCCLAVAHVISVISTLQGAINIILEWKILGDYIVQSSWFIDDKPRPRGLQWLIHCHITSHWLDNQFNFYPAISHIWLSFVAPWSVDRRKNIGLMFKMTLPEF
jgi:hypothetical protein